MHETIMKNKVTFARNLAQIGFAVACPVAAFLLSNCSAQGKVRNDNKNQLIYLNSCFSVIKRSKDKIRVVVRPYRGLSLGVGNRDLRTGSQFRISERHFRYNYVVQAIETDGIRISYTGRHDPPVDNVVGGPVAGVVKLKWKP